MNNHISLLFPDLTALVNRPDPVHLAITLVLLGVAVWISYNDWQGPEGRL